MQSFAIAMAMAKFTVIPFFLAYSTLPQAATYGSHLLHRLSGKTLYMLLSVLSLAVLPPVLASWPPCP
jgi:hypothetical protein